VEHLIQSPVQAPLYDHDNRMLRLHRVLDTSPRHHSRHHHHLEVRSDLHGRLKSQLAPAPLTVESRHLGQAFITDYRSEPYCPWIARRADGYQTTITIVPRSPMRTLSSSLRKTIRRLVSMAGTWLGAHVEVLVQSPV